jgi:hypothetical protein
MSCFRKPFTILKETPGSYVLGLWVPGAKVVQKVQSSVQPITMGQDMDVLPEGRHMSDFVKFYTDTKLTTTADGEGTQPDIIVFDGYGFEIISQYKNQSGVISHYKYIASKVFKFTSDADWLSGALVRP